MERQGLATAILAMVVFVSACGDSGSPTEPTATQVAAPPSTVMPPDELTTTAATATGETGLDSATTSTAALTTTTAPIPTTGPTTTQVSTLPTRATLPMPTDLVQVLPDGEAFAGAVMADVTAAASGLVAVGTSSHNAPAFWTSENGTAWSRSDAPELTAAAFAWGVAKGGPGVVAVGAEEDDVAAVWTSADGTEWVRVPDQDSLEAAEMHAVTAFNGGLVAVGFARVSGEPSAERFAVVWNSPDGISWARVPHDESVFGEDSAMWDVVAAGPGLVAVGGDHQASLVWTSPDGATWERVDRETHQEPFLDDTFMYAVAAAQDLIVAGGFDMEGEGANMWTSPDGVTWSLLPRASWAEFERSTVTGIVSNDGGWIAVGNGLWTSPDGFSWTQEADQFTLWPIEFTGAANFGGGVFAVGSNWETGSAVVWKFTG